MDLYSIQDMVCGSSKTNNFPFPFPPPSLPPFSSMNSTPFISSLPRGMWRVAVNNIFFGGLNSITIPSPSLVYYQFWFDWILSPPHPFPYLLLVLVWLNFIYTPFLIHYQFRFEFFLPFPRSLLCVSMKIVTHTTDRFIKKQFLLEYETLPLGFFMKVVTHTHTTDTDRFDKIFLLYWIK